MGKPLTVERRNALRAAAASGNRETYYKLLVDYEYDYGKLALEVAYKRGINGAVANEYMLSVARKNGVSFSDQRLEAFSIALMQADWAARESLGVNSTRDLNRGEYRGFHVKTLEFFGLPPEAWTAETALKLAGSAAASDAMWQSMVDAQSFIPQVVNGGNVFFATASRNRLYLNYVIAEFGNGPGVRMTPASSAAAVLYAFKKGWWGETATERAAAEWTSHMTSTGVLTAVVRKGGTQAVEELLNVRLSKQVRGVLTRAISPLRVGGISGMKTSFNLHPPIQDRIVPDADGNPVGVSKGYYDYRGEWVELSRTVTLFSRDKDGKVLRDANRVAIEIGRQDSNPSGRLNVETTYNNRGEIVDTALRYPGNPIGIQFADAGGVIGQQLGYRLAGSNKLTGIVASATLQTLGHNLGEALDAVAFGGPKEIGNNVNKAFADIGDEFLTNLKSAGHLQKPLAFERVI
jgi:hypothetical protein